MKKTDLAWVAGFVDGEGTIEQQGNSPRIRICQKDIMPLLRVKNTFHIGGIFRQKNGLSYLHIYHATGASAILVLSLIYPYLTVKREKVFDVLTHWKYINDNKGKAAKDRKNQPRLLELQKLRQTGHSFTTIGKLLNISRQRAHQIYKALKNQENLSNQLQF